MNHKVDWFDPQTDSDVKTIITILSNLQYEIQQTYKNQIARDCYICTCKHVFNIDLLWLAISSEGYFENKIKL